MATSFTSLPIIDLLPLCSGDATDEEFGAHSSELHDMFASVGFAYLVNVPLSFDHQDVFDLAKEFFSLSEDAKMGVAKKHSEGPTRTRTEDEGSTGLLGQHRVPPPKQPNRPPFVLTEPSCFPPTSEFPFRERLETLYAELSSLANTLLALLAVPLGKHPAAFTSMMRNSVSTLRLLHYPGSDGGQEDALCCSPHTDSGLLTLLHQDATVGLGVLNAAGDWIPAQYVPGSIVVNVGDLMARMSGGRLVATEHRVRSSGRERFSVPFFLEPGVDTMVGERGRQVRYEEFVLGKMNTWVEFQDVGDRADEAAAY